MSKLNFIEAAGEVLGRYGQSRISRRATLSTPLALGVAKTLERVAHADDLRPPIFVGSDGRKFAPMDFKEAGRAYIITSNAGLSFGQNEGLAYGGKVRAIVVSNEPRQNLEVRELECGGGLSIDVIADVGGDDYNTRSPNAMKILGQEMEQRMTPLERTTWSEIGMMLVTDQLDRPAPPELLGGSKDLGLRGSAKGCGPIASTGRTSSASAESQGAGQAVAECPTSWEMPGLFRASGVPSVGVGNIDFAKPPVFNWGNLPPGMRVFFAEPGGLLVGPDFPADKVKSSGGAINYINPINQQGFQRSEFSGDIPWKGYAMFSLEEGRLSIPDEDACLSLTLLQRAGANNYLVFVKGRNGDQQLDRTAKWDGAVGGHAIYQKYDHAAFVSAGQLDQLAADSFKMASKTTVIGLDLNTRAMMIVEQDRGSGTWRWVNANYSGI